MRIAFAVKHLRPDAQFTINGDKLIWEIGEDGKPYPKNLIWISEDVEPFTEDEFNDAVEFVKQFEVKEYQVRRMNEYPALADFADAYYHQQTTGDDSKMKDYLDKVKKVKEKYPK